MLMLLLAVALRGMPVLPDDPPPVPPPEPTAAVAFVALTGTAVFPNQGGWPATAALEAGFEPAPAVRCLFVGTFLFRDLPPRGRASLWGPFPRLMTGVDVVITPWLPVELSVGATLGLTFAADGDILGFPAFTAQLRSALGYRLSDHFMVALCASANGVVTGGQNLFWAELGARLALRW